jgi:hypothetical protein
MRSMVLSPFLVILLPLASEMTLWTHSTEETRSDTGGHKSSSVSPGYRRETLAKSLRTMSPGTAGAPTRPSWVSAAGAITNNLPTKLGVASLVWAGSPMGSDAGSFGQWRDAFILGEQADRLRR